MIRLAIERILKPKNSVQNHFFVKAEYIKNGDPYCEPADYGLFVMEFYLNSSPKIIKPIRYLKFRTYVNVTELPKVEDSEKETDMIYNNFTINTLLKKFKNLIFKDKTLPNGRIYYFLRKKDFLRLCLDLLDYVDEDTSYEYYNKMKNFILHHKFLYLLS